jgi:aryl-alcohol dehydrogenase-like predicted oxidoreductase
MMFGAYGNTDHEDSIRIIHRALDAGINFIDTADVYSRGESEEIVGKALAGGRREEVVLATKVHGKMHDSDPNQFGNSRRWIVQAQWTAERRGRERFVCEQPPYSMLNRAIEADVLPVCEEYGIGVIPWSPLAMGWLSGRYSKGGETPDASRRAQMMPSRYDMSDPANQRKLEAAQALGELADEAGMSLIELALAFVNAHPAVTAAIIGPRTSEHLDSQLPALESALPADVLDKIDQIVAPGTNVKADERGWDPPWLADAAQRRR